MGETTFCDLPFLTSPGRVMTPRPATEALVERAVERIGDRALRVADVGTGAGVIAVALAVHAPRADVWASDMSAEAVELACVNAERFGVADRVHCVEGDLLDPIPDGLDLVVANLPYLPDWLADPELAGEPPEAVYAAGDGLEPYRRLLDQCEKRLAEDGAVVVQFRRRVLEAEWSRLHDLRERLEHLS
jgi:release factor glutamine methyltransferase